MYEVSSKLYFELSQRLIEALSADDYYSDSIEFEFDDVTCRLLVSAVIYSQSECLPEGREIRFISDIIPVWWEFHTFTEDGEVINDFSFNELRNYIKQL